jgi:hypothetical protein
MSAAGSGAIVRGDASAPERGPVSATTDGPDGNEAIVRTHRHVANQPHAERGERGLDDQQAPTASSVMSR